MKILEIAKAVCLCLALLALAAAALAFALNFGTPKYLVDRLTEGLTVTVQDEGAKTRAAALIGLAETRTDALARVDRLIDVAQHEIKATRMEASAHIIGLADVADRRLASIQRDVNAHGQAVEQIAAREVGRAVDGWTKTAEPLAALAQELAQAAPGILEPLTDCEDNPSCFDNRWRGLTFDLEQTMRAVKDAAPRVGNAAADTSVSVASMASSAEKWVGRELAPKSKKQTALAIVERFGLIGIRAWLLL